MRSRNRTGNKAHWTKHRYGWLDGNIDGLSDSVKANLELVLRQFKGMNDILPEYDQQIEVLATTPCYEKPVLA